MRDCLVIFAKVPELGRVKTRLASAIGDAAARDLAEAFVTDTLATAASLEAVRIVVAYSPSTGTEWFRERAPGAALIPQPDLDFGARMSAAMHATFELGVDRCVMIGMDTPQLEPATIRRAFEALGEVDVCLGPSADGGYYLIGLRGAAPRLFEEIAWSTSTVLTETRARAAKCGMSVTELGREVDVDEAADLEALRVALVDRPGVGAASRIVLERIPEAL